ncbi:MAG: peptidylprolyl isomerase [Synechococcaceae cyanobacterium]|jgi:parvulin-like peptidyl-prolyl isomerase|nr:peptidylprolyl isomerase [Synechococcaceae cyanobacterium]
MSESAGQQSVALTPRLVALLRRHNLLLPLLKGSIEDQLAAAVVLEPSQQQELLARWAGSGGVEAALAKAQQESGLTPTDVLWQVERPSKLVQIAQERFASKAEARFLQRKAQLDLVTYSMVRLKDANLARELYLRLAAGEASFAELSKQYSEGHERKSLGQIGPYPISNAHPELAERLRSARDGEVMAPFQVLEWWLVVRRETYEPAVLDEAMAKRMANELLQEWVEEEARRRLQELNSLISAGQPTADQSSQ